MASDDYPYNGERIKKIKVRKKVVVVPVFPIVSLIVAIITFIYASQ